MLGLIGDPLDGKNLHYCQYRKDERKHCGYYPQYRTYCGIIKQIYSSDGKQ